MDLSSKKILLINLAKRSSEIKTFPDLKKYLGGVGLGLRLYELYANLDPVIFSVGPLNGFFPYASKTSIVLGSEGSVEDIYVGGYLSTRIKFADLDAVVFLDKADKDVIISIENENVVFKDMDTKVDSLGLPGKRTLITREADKVFVDQYFTPPENFLFKSFAKKNIKAIGVTGTRTFTPPDMEKYGELYRNLVLRSNELDVEKGFFPSCSGCPMGCEKSKVGELGGNILSHCLVACGFAENIYSDVGTIFSCVNVLGYDYTHEDIESLPEIVQNTLKNLS